MHRALTLFLVAALSLTPSLLMADDEPVSGDITLSGVKIHYLSQGQGDAVILIHGLDENADHNWVQPGTMALLAKTHHVVALDLAGFGASDKPPELSDYGDAWVEDIDALMNGLKIDRAQIVGYSIGSFVALKFIAEHPERSISGFLGGMGFMAAGGRYPHVWQLMKTKPQQAVAQLTLTEEQVKAIKTPVMMAVGARDPLRVQYIDPLVKVRPDWHLAEIANGGTFSSFLKPDFKAALESWINQPHGS